MIKRIFVFGAVLLITAFGYAQEGTTSPYSFYGIGELKFKGTVENQSMGGISVYTDSIHLNLRNPASFSDLKITTYTAGLTHNSTQYKNATSTNTLNNMSFDYLALGFPIAKNAGLGFGLISYSSVGYDLESEGNVDGQSTLDEFNGKGGLNKVFLSLGYKVIDNISLGITGNYSFGKLDNQNSRIIDDVIFGTQETNKSDLSGIDFNLGITYKGQILNDLTFRSALSFSPESKISSKNSREISSFTDFPGRRTNIETEVVDLEASGLDRTDITLPSNVSFGVGLGKEHKWFVGTEVQSIKTGDFENPFLVNNGVTYKDAFTMSVGGFYIPNYTSFTSYWSKVVYRGGFKFEETGLIINNEEINNFGISFGLGLPIYGLRDRFSNINLDFEYGKRGTLNSGLIEENYFNVKLSLSLNELWFRKRKYD